MAVALAHEFLRLGAQVTLVSANITDENLSALQYCGKQSELKIVKVTTALELAEKMEQLAPNADALIMAAAVSDYRVASAQSVKLKRSDALQELVLVPNPDILKHLVDTRNARKAQVICGFAAETGSPEKTYLEYGKEKARRKGADLLAINQVGQELGFGDVQTELSFVDRDGKILAAASGSKLEVAKAFAAFISEQVLALESS
ncbi:phosphopantothenoylcysteine decarboxylase domain-containing protein [Arcanobacterium hippocoleae]